MFAQLTDIELAGVLRHGDLALVPRAYDEWLRRHGARARGVAAKALRRYALPGDLADDAVQQGSLLFLMHLGRLDPDRPPLPYFLRIVGNSAVDIRRREMRHRLGPKALKARDPDRGPEEAASLRDSVESLLKRCSPDEKDLMIAHYLLGRSAAEIARQRGLSVRAVYRGLHQGRTRVREGR